MSSIFPFALSYQNEFILWKSKLADKLEYADNLGYSDKLLLTSHFGEFSFKDILAVYPKEFYFNKSTPLLVIFTNLGFFCKTTASKYGFYMSYYNADFSLIQQDAEDKFVLPVKCKLFGRRFRIEATNPFLLDEIISITRMCSDNIKYWIQHKKQQEFYYMNPAYSVKYLPCGNLERQFAFNNTLPSSTEKCFSLPETQFETEQCVLYQNTRFSRGRQELFSVLDKLYFIT